MALLTVEIVTPERVVVREEVSAISLPTPEGEISILPHHVSYLGALAPGVLQLRKDSPSILDADSDGGTSSPFDPELRVEGGSPRAESRGGTEIILAVSGGVVEIRDGHHLRILADTAERAEEIDEARAEEARKRAIELRKQVIADDTAFTHASAAIEKELARLRVVRRRRHRGHHGVSRGALGE